MLPSYPANSFRAVSAEAKNRKGSALRLLINSSLLSSNAILTTAPMGVLDLTLIARAALLERVTLTPKFAAIYSPFILDFLSFSPCSSTSLIFKCLARKS